VRAEDALILTYLKLEVKYQCWRMAVLNTYFSGGEVAASNTERIRKGKFILY
jgi:hypothetical protein